MQVLREQLEEVDARLASVARGEAALRLRLGQALEVLGRGEVFGLGFSSLGAYAVERCERSVRWAEGARSLARRLEVLPVLREATAVGRVSWSMAEVLARVATTADESRWVELAEGRTVRQVRELVAHALVSRETAAERVYARVVGPCRGGADATGEPLPCERLERCDGLQGVASEGVASEGIESGVGSECIDGECIDSECIDSEGARGGPVTLACTVSQEDAWFFEATRRLLEQLGARTADEQTEALLAEAGGTLQSLLPEGSCPAVGSRERHEGQRRWLSELRRWRARAEAACERNILASLLGGRAQVSRAGHERSTVALAAALGMATLEGASGGAIDAQVRALARAIASRELELSRLLLVFHRADGWRRLGYASEAHYARERLGSSPSLLLARRSLASKLERLPQVAAALGSGEIGVEAAVQLVRVATAATEAAWVARARRRTIKHLREEVAAALVAVRWSGEPDCPPPLGPDIEAFHQLEQAVVSGRLAVAGAGLDPVPGVGIAPSLDVESGRFSGERRAWLVMLASLSAWLQRGLQTFSAAGGAAGAPREALKAGRVVVRLRLSKENAAWWRELESQARRWLPCGVSWLRFACLSLWHAWQHLLGAPMAYGHIYIRDRFRCMSPVCPRRDVTPHHLRFRSAGGGEEPENIGSLCTWCHLFGVHGGRLRARGPAGRIRWELGPVGAPCVVVHGRERVAA